MKKSMLNSINLFILFFILLFLLNAHMVYAETKTFIKEYTYRASDEDSKNSSRTIALREVKRLLLEELGTYLESVSEVKDFQLTKDQITTLTAGIVRTEMMDERWDGKIYWLRTKITADPGSVAKSIDRLRQDRTKVKELEEVQNRANKLLKENERLKEELKTAKGSVKEKKQEEYARGIKELSAIEWYEIGYSLAVSKQYKEAINAFNKTIERNPGHATVYDNRGYVYNQLGDYKKAIKDFDKAIDLNPEYASAYSNRGLAYSNIGNYQQAVKDYDKGIELNTEIASVYNDRGVALYNLGNYQQSVKDCDKALKLNPEYSLALSNRGLAYAKLGNYKQAISDSKKAVELNPGFSLSYYNIACYYSLENNIAEAYRWFKKSIEKGCNDWNFIKSDSGIDNIRNSVCYKEIMSGK